MLKKYKCNKGFSLMEIISLIEIIIVIVILFLIIGGVLMGSCSSKKIVGEVIAKESPAIKDS